MLDIFRKNRDVAGRPRRGLFSVFLLISMVPLSVSVGVAQNYPAKALHFIVPFSAGGGTDIVARFLAQHLTKSLGQPVVVVNKPGASSIIGTEMVAKAAPDGYTILLGNNGALTINPSMFQKLPYDPVKDFSPITLLGSVPMVLLVHPSVPAKSVKDLIALAKTWPGQLSFGSTGKGIVIHLAAEMLKSMAGINMVAVYYKGAGPALTDLMGGQIHMMFSGALAALAPVRSGKLRGLAVTSAERSAILPDVPAIAESGLPGFEATVWYAVLAPVRTRQEVIERLNAEFVKVLKNPTVQEKLSSESFKVIGSSPEALTAAIRSDMAKWAKVIKETGLSNQEGGS